MRTLIVEDNAVNREFLRVVMEEYGSCDTVESGEEALAAMERATSKGSSYDLIFMDIMLPGIDGLQALEKIRDIEVKSGIVPGKAAKVIVATALDDDKNASRAFFQGQAISYITKPLTISKIQDELKKFDLVA